MVIDVIKNKTIPLGRIGENEARQIRFDVGEILASWPAAAFMLLNQRPQDDAAYPVVSSAIRMEGTRLIWTVASGDVARTGHGRLELVARQDDVIVKSVIYSTITEPALDGSGEVPEPWESWVGEVTDAADRAESAAELLESPGVEVETLEPDESGTGSYADGTFTFGIPRGHDGEKGDPGDDGYSPSIAVSEISGGHLVTVTDKTGSSSFNVMDGRKGDPGTPGTPGQDGVSPTLSVADIIGGHRITITDKTGTRSVDVMDGVKGDDGISPVASVSKSGSTATITITDKNGTTSATVSDGAALIDDTAGAGDTDKAWSADKNAGELSNLNGAINQKYTKPQTGIPASDMAAGVIPSVPVQDVQVNGTSVVQDGVANVPIANNTLGLVKVGGNGLLINTTTGQLQVQRGTDVEVKLGANGNKPICPYSQHMSTFYGLAKAAGADMASSSNPVGTYTDAAKVAIQKMLGIYEAPWELIREDTFTNETSADHVVNTDANGQSFELVEAIILFETPVQDTESSIGSSGGLKFGYITPASGSTNYATKIEIGSWTQAANASAHGGAGVFKQDNGLVQIYRASNTTPSNTGSIGLRYGAGFPNLGASDRIGFAIISETWYVNSITIMTVTGTGHYKLFGRRKWTA